MTRAFDRRALPPTVLDELLDLASRAPSAGNTQGWQVLVLEGPDTTRFWDITLPPERRVTFAWPHLLDAPALVLPYADPGAYVARYAEPDKAATGLGAGAAAWPAPYWTIDAAMSVMTLLLAAEDAGIGALLFGVFHGEQDLRAAFGVPPELELLGAVALGYPAAEAARPGRSATRPRRPLDAFVHRGTW